MPQTTEDPARQSELTLPRQRGLTLTPHPPHPLRSWAFSPLVFPRCEILQWPRRLRVSMRFRDAAWLSIVSTLATFSIIVLTLSSSSIFTSPLCTSIISISSSYPLETTPPQRITTQGQLDLLRHLQYTKFLQEVLGFSSDALMRRAIINTRYSVLIDLKCSSFAQLGLLNFGTSSNQQLIWI